MPETVVRGVGPPPDFTGRKSILDIPKIMVEGGEIRTHLLLAKSPAKTLFFSIAPCSAPYIPKPLFDVLYQRSARV